MTLIRRSADPSQRLWWMLLNPRCSAPPEKQSARSTNRSTLFNIKIAKKREKQSSGMWQYQSKEKTKYVITHQSQRNLWFFYIPDNLLSKRYKIAHMFKNLVFKLLNCVKVWNIWPKWIGGWYHIRLSYLESHQSHKSCVTFVSTALTKLVDIDLISSAMLSYPYDKYL